MKTLNQVRSLLGDIEPTENTFAPLDSDDIPHLATLLGDGEEWLAARAVHGLSRLDDPRARDAITQAAADSRGAVRVAVATALPRLPAAFAERLMGDLLADHDIGVRKLALRSVPAVVPVQLRSKIEQIAKTDASEPIRALARSVHARLR